MCALLLLLEPGSGGKRARADGAQSDSDDDLEAALAKFLLDKKLDSTASALKQYIDKKREKIDGKLEKAKQQVDGMGVRQDKVDNDQKGMLASINSMQNALAMADTTSRSFPAGASSDPIHQ